MFGLIKKIFIGLLISTANVSNHAKCVSLCNQKCMTEPTLINLHRRIQRRISLLSICS